MIHYVTEECRTSLVMTQTPGSQQCAQIAQPCSFFLWNFLLKSVKQISLQLENPVVFLGKIYQITFLLTVLYFTPNMWDKKAAYLTAQC